MADEGATGCMALPTTKSGRAIRTSVGGMNLYFVRVLRSRLSSVLTEVIVDAGIVSVSSSNAVKSSVAVTVAVTSHRSLM